MSSAAALSLRKIADRCVMCGLCVPHCPTYRKLKTEADSPRGRIALIQGVLDARIPANDRFVEHLDLCLTCRACERVCPNEVSFGELITGMREQIAGERSITARIAAKLGRLVLRKPRLIEKMAPLIAFVRASRLHRLHPEARELDTWLALAGRSVPGEFYPAPHKPRGEVGLFLGCVARLFDSETLRSAIFVLNSAGFDVRVPRTQACCGALSQHAGDLAAMKKLMERNVLAFKNLDTIVTTASACGLTLRECGPPDFSRKVCDASEFLAREQGLGRLRPLEATIAVHEPCTSRAGGAAIQLLQKIPGATVIPLPGNDQCCGGAGTYFLQHRKIAKALRQDKIDALSACGADIVATSNIGCALHMKGAGIQALHQVTLIARQSVRS